MSMIHVALVEDHDLTRVAIRTALHQSGQVQLVGEATNGTDGLRLIQRTQPDVAIVDISLPGIDGIELTRQLKQSLQSAKEAETKVLMLTLQDNEAMVLAAFAAGADSYCLKDSLNLHNLLKVLQATSGGQCWIDPLVARAVLKQNRKVYSRSNRTSTVAIHAVPTEYTQLLKADPLTPRQLDILELIVAGYSNKEIAKHCYLTVGTVKTHVRSILNKLVVDDRTKAAVQALRAGLVD